MRAYCSQTFSNWRSLFLSPLFHCINWRSGLGLGGLSREGYKRIFFLALKGVHRFFSQPGCWDAVFVDPAGELGAHPWHLRRPAANEGVSRSHVSSGTLVMLLAMKAVNVPPCIGLSFTSCPWTKGGASYVRGNQNCFRV